MDGSWELWKRGLCVFQGAVGACLASTAPAAATAVIVAFDELGHLVESAVSVLCLEHLAETCTSTGWYREDIQWEVAP